MLVIICQSQVDKYVGFFGFTLSLICFDPFILFGNVKELYAKLVIDHFAESDFA